MSSSYFSTFSIFAEDTKASSSWPYVSHWDRACILAECSAEHFYTESLLYQSWHSRFVANSMTLFAYTIRYGFEMFFGVPVEFFGSKLKCVSSTTFQSELDLLHKISKVKFFSGKNG